MLIDEFVEYMTGELNKTQNTVEAYRRDMTALKRYMDGSGIELTEVNDTDMAGYFLELKKEGKSSSTMRRKLASIRMFYSFLVEHGRVSKNPAARLSVPKQEQEEIEYLTYEEIVRLLETPDDSPAGIRDRAILEAMYATGMRVAEAIEVKVSDCNTLMGFISFGGRHGKARIVPLGGPAKRALDEYISRYRTEMLKGEEDHGYLFVNYMGKPMTRQGLWKILKAYGRKAGLEDRMTPHILRSSFAVHMVQNGADIKSLQELMGHEDIAATQVYMNVKKSKIKEVYDRTHPRA